MRRRRALPLLSALCAALAACAAGAGSSAPAAGGATGSTTTTSSGGQAGASPTDGATAGSPRSSDGRPAQITLAFAGDVHFESQVAALLDDSAQVWGQRLPELRDADFSLVNLETAITRRGTPQPKPYTFRTPPTALDKLKEAGVDAVSMANNHAADYGALGVQDTLTAKASNVLPIVGFGPDAASAYAPLEVDVSGVKVAVLAASQVAEETARNWAAGASSPGIAVALDRTNLREAVRAAAATHDLVVVQMHWGTEGSSCPNETQAATVSELQTDGADVVVGTHAHRPQGSGWSGRTFVGYGTGNFIWYNTSANSRPSGVLTVTVDADAARARGQAGGADRTTATSLVTAYAWTPKYIAGNGVPRDPQGDTRGRLASLARAATSCANLQQSPS